MMSTGTITSVYQTRKRRYQAPRMETTKPNGKKTSQDPGPSTSRSSTKSQPSPVALSPKTRPSVRHTSIRVLGPQLEPQPEISWSCQSPEFTNVKPKRRNLRPAPEKDMLSLIDNMFDATPVKKDEGKKDSLLLLWKAPSEGSISQFPKEVQYPDTGQRAKAVKTDVEEELQQLVSQVKSDKEIRPDPRTTLSRQVTKRTEDPKRPIINGPDPSTSHQEHRRNLERENVTDNYHASRLENGKKCPMQKSVADANSSDTWSDEDLFNDEEFIAQTQKIMTAHGVLNFSQACTQVIDIAEETSESNDGSRDISTFGCAKPLVEEAVTAGPNFTVLKSAKSEHTPSVDLDEFLNCDDGIDDIMCAFGDLDKNKEDSIDFMMNCDTLPYPSQNHAPSPVPNDSEVSAIRPTQVVNEDKTSSNKQIHTSPWKLTPLPAEGSNNKVTEKEQVVRKLSYAPVAGSSRSSAPPHKPVIKNSNSSKPVPPKVRYTAEEIERKKQEALEKRRRKLEQINSPAYARVISSQFMPAKKK